MAYDCHSVPSCFAGKSKHSRPQSAHMVYFRNDSWTEDLTLKEELSKLVGKVFNDRKGLVNFHYIIIEAISWKSYSTFKSMFFFVHKCLPIIHRLILKKKNENPI